MLSIGPMSIAAGAIVILCGLALLLPVFSARDGDGPRKNWLSVLSGARTPLMLLALLILLELLIPSVSFITPKALSIWSLLYKIGTVVLITIALIYLIEGIERVLLVRSDITVSDNLKARQIHTQVRVLSRTVQVAIVVIALGVLLMSFDAARQFGASLLASAGIASLALGLAARPALENLIAGVQIALTQPIRLDDVVVVEGEWGRIEEIESTYVTIRIWDDRRLVVPLRYFLEHSFENWTKTSSQLLGTVFIRCDFRIDVDALRARLKALCEGNENWDKRVAIIQVTDSTERAVELRALVSSSTSPKLWDLRVAVREGLIRFINESAPDAMPRTRASVELLRDERISLDDDSAGSIPACQDGQAPR